MTENSGIPLPFKKLCADQLVIEVVAFMSINGLSKMPVYRDNFLLGIISYSEILNFLHHEPEKNLYHHKLNYTIESLIVLINKP